MSDNIQEVLIDNIKVIKRDSVKNKHKLSINNYNLPIKVWKKYGDEIFDLIGITKSDVKERIKDIIKLHYTIYNLNK